jgi:hypothetical protein
MTEEDAEVMEMVWEKLANKRAHLDVECTADNGEQEVAWCQEAMSRILNTTAEKIRICAKSQRQ